MVAAVPPEIRPAIRALRARRGSGGGGRGTSTGGGRSRAAWDAGAIVLACGGIGAEAAAACARDLLDRFRIEVLVSAGFAGAVRRGVATGDLIVGGTAGFAADPEALARARAAFPAARVGNVVAVGKIHRGGTDAENAARYGIAVAVDMESAAVGRVARERAVPFLCVKAILDTPDAPLASGYAGVGSVLWEIVRDPRVLAGIFTDARRARRAAGRLAEFFSALAPTLSA